MVADCKMLLASNYQLISTVLAIILIGLLIDQSESCSIYCEDGKIPCGGYGTTCDGFKGCVFPGECADSGFNPGGGNPNVVTVPTNYDVIRPYGPIRTTRRPNKRYGSLFNRSLPSFFRRRYNRYFV